MQLLVDIDIPFTFNVPEVREEVCKEVERRLREPFDVVLGPPTVTIEAVIHDT